MFSNSVSVRSAWLAAAGFAAVAVGMSASAKAEPVPPLFDGKGTTYYILSGSILRKGESFFSGVVATVGKGTPTVQGNGVCSQVACPVLFGGESVFARRTRLSLPEKDGKKPTVGQEVAAALNIPDKERITDTLRRGDEGRDVLHLQEALNRAGAKIIVDQNYGRSTVEAVTKFQTDKKIKADGVAGPETLKALGIYAEKK